MSFDRYVSSAIRESPRFKADMLIESDPSAPEMLWYLSFVEEQEDKWLGGLYLRGKSLSGVMTKSHLLGVNPGGAVELVEVPAEVAARIHEKWIGRLLTCEEMAEFDREVGA